VLADIEHKLACDVRVTDNSSVRVMIRIVCCNHRLADGVVYAQIIDDPRLDPIA
jgi:hypothetical protein